MSCLNILVNNEAKDTKAFLITFKATEFVTNQ
jgi:hypothetical protein